MKSYNSAPNSTPVGPPPTMTVCRSLLLSSSLTPGVAASSRLFNKQFLIFLASDTCCS